MSVSRKDTLNGWKEIARYVARDIRTVERWEKQRGLPVRRVPGSGRSAVYAHISELEGWLASGHAEDAQQPETAFAAIGVAREELPLTAVVTLPAVDALPSVGPFDTAMGLSPALAPEALPVPHAWIAPAGIEGARIEAHADPLARASGSGAWGRFGRAAAVLSMTFGLVAVVAVAAALMRRTEPTKVEAGTKVSPRVFEDPYRSAIAGVEDLYLRGTYQCEQRTPDSLHRALDDFSQAIALDANYAPAYAGLANTYNLLREYSVMTDAEAYPNAKSAAQRAIALNPRLAEAHASLGFVQFFWYLQPAVAEGEFRTAIALDPGLTLAHHWYGSLLTHEGRFAEAAHELDTAQRLEPSSRSVVVNRALVLGLSGHRDQGISLLRELLQPEQRAGAENSLTAHRVMSTLWMVQPRDILRYLDEQRRCATILHDQDWLAQVKMQADAYRTGGEPKMWRAVLDREEHLHPERRPTLRMAEAEAALGEKDRALEDLMSLAKRHDPSLANLSSDSLLIGLHDDARFAKIRNEVGLPPTL